MFCVISVIVPYSVRVGISYGFFTISLSPLPFASSSSLKSRCRAETKATNFYRLELVVGKNERLREVTRVDRSYRQGYSSNVEAVKSLQWDASGSQILLLGQAADGTLSSPPLARCFSWRPATASLFMCINAFMCGRLLPQIGWNPFSS
jgi:hypothetical protein